MYVVFNLKTTMFQCVGVLAIFRNMLAVCMDAFCWSVEPRGSFKLVVLSIPKSQFYYISVVNIIQPLSDECNSTCIKVPRLKQLLYFPHVGKKVTTCVLYNLYNVTVTSKNHTHVSILYPLVQKLYVDQTYKRLFF